MRRQLTSRGYILLYEPRHPLAQKRGWVLLHRKLWYDANGPIPPGRVIHHKNGDITDNRPSNLECISRAKHTMAHGGLDEYNATRGPWNKGTAKHIVLICPECHRKFRRLLKEHQKNRRGGRESTCSRSCASKRQRFARARAGEGEQG